MQDDFSLESYNYSLPAENIAQHPASARDHSRLLILNRETGAREHKLFRDISAYIAAGDVVVVNDTRVFPARLLGKKESGGKAEVFLLEFPRLTGQEEDEGAEAVAAATALVKSSRRPAPGSCISFSESLRCRIVEHLDGSKIRVTLHFPRTADLASLLQEHGTVPLPPYIEREGQNQAADRERYQTVYARSTGAVAAPTAGLHFTEELFAGLRRKGVHIAALTLHVGYGTFAPVRTANLRDHRLHSEYVSLPAATAALINERRREGGKIWAVGTTTVRALEFAAREGRGVEAVSGWCDLYIYPGYGFRVIDNLITNFHLPKSSLLFLVSALCGRELLLDCYREAIGRDYRFYSYGDAMAIIS